MCNPNAVTPAMRREMMDHFQSMEGNRHEFEIVRGRIQKGRTFSEDAMEALMWEIRAFIGGRLMHRWETTGEPPTALRLTIELEAR